MQITGLKALKACIHAFVFLHYVNLFFYHRLFVFWKDTLDMSPAPRQRRQGLNRRHSSEEDEEEDVSEGEDSQVDSYEEYDDDEHL